MNQGLRDAARDCVFYVSKYGGELFFIVCHLDMLKDSVSFTIESQIGKGKRRTIIRKAKI